MQICGHIVRKMMIYFESLLAHKLKLKYRRYDDFELIEKNTHIIVIIKIIAGKY
jgi:hypothetical protein